MNKDTIVKIRKIVGKILYRGIAYWLPKSHGKLSLGISKNIRGGCARLMLDSVGSPVNIERKAFFSDKCTIGHNSGIGKNALLGEVHIGNYVMMGPECYIYTNNHNYSRLDVPMIEQGMSETRPVYIDDDVWIGSRVTILPGVHIGKGVVIGTGSVVTKDVEPYCVVGGNPARVLKRRHVD